MKFIFFYFCIFIPISFAFKVTPMVVDFDSQGKDATQSFNVEHAGPDKIAVEVKVATRELSKKGEEIRNSTKDLLAYPPQLILGPGDKKKIRASYIGQAFKGAQKSYRVIFKQLPVKLSKKKSNQKAQLNFLFEYVASAYVNGDDNGKEKVAIVSAKKIKAKKWKIVLKNTGDRHILLKNWRLIAESKGKQRSVKLRLANGKELPNLLAGATVEFVAAAKTNVKTIWKFSKK